MAFCELCGADRESIKHILTECTAAKMFWREVKIITGVKLPSLHPVSWGSDLLMDELCNDKEWAIFIIGMYSLWMQWNQRRHGDVHKPVSVAVRWSLDTALDLWNMNKPMKPVKERNSVQRWRVPLVGRFKCNTDGAFYLDQGQSASGVALRNDAGLFVGGQARWYPHGLVGARGVQCLILETDSQEFVKLWKEGANQRSRIASIIRETREISSSFVDFSVVSTCRSCNRVAHVLAKQV